MSINVYLLRKEHRIENLLILITCVLLYVFNTFIFSKLNDMILKYFFSCYFNDLLAPILLFSYINLILSLINKKIYSLKYLMIIIIPCSLIWEYLAIFLKPTSVSDPMDILFYFYGTFIYWMVYKIWVQKKENNDVTVSDSSTSIN